jgi:hypothetical protein
MDPLAIFGAVTATAAIAWQVFTWLRKGAKLCGYVTPEMAPNIAINEDDAEIELEVRNVGDAATTISSVILVAYNRTWLGLRGKRQWTTTMRHDPPKYTLSPRGKPIKLKPQTIPYTLPGGGRFVSRVPQSPWFERESRENCLYMGVHHSMARKPFLVRVQPIAMRKRPDTLPDSSTNGARRGARAGLLALGGVSGRSPARASGVTGSRVPRAPA